MKEIFVKEYCWFKNGKGEEKMLPDLKEIKFKRKNSGMTQKELSEKTGLSQSLVSKIEAGGLVPNFENARKIFECLEELEKSKEARASEVMSKKLRFVSLDSSLSDAVGMFSKHSVSQVPAMESGKVFGTVSEKGILARMQSWNGSKDLRKIKIEEFLEDAMPIVQESTPLSAVAELLNHSQAVLVGKAGKITGIITQSDVLKASWRRRK